VSLLKEANLAFQQKRYMEALHLYELAQKDNAALAESLSVNIKISSAYANKNMVYKEGLNSNKEKVVVYTCNFGNYESVKEPLHVDPSVEYILFTDRLDLQSKYWKIIVLNLTQQDTRRASRLPKILSHKFLPPHDVSVYIDSSLEIKEANIRKMISECMKGKDIALYRHYKRNCVYDEIDFVMNSTDRVVENKELCLKQKEKYEEISYPKKNGLFENAFIFRRNVPVVRQVNETWWAEYQAGTERDQFTLMYALAVNSVFPSSIEIGKQFRVNPYVNFHKHSYRPHLKKKEPYVFIAYAPQSYNMNLGRCYNEYMERLEEDDYALFIDHDAMFVDGSWKSVVDSAISNHQEEEALFISQTNRINNPYQRLNLLEDNHNTLDHQIFASKVAERYSQELVECSKLPSSSGVIIMLSKKTWHNHKFTDGFLKVDNNIHISQREASNPVYLMKGLHVYHFYRADNDSSHAVKDISILPRDTESGIGHIVRNFVYNELTIQVMYKYMSMVKDDEYAVFISQQSMFCNKDWYLRICDLLQKDNSIGMLIFNDNSLDPKAPFEMDVLKHKTYASGLEVAETVPVLELRNNIEKEGLSNFLISKKAWNKFISNNDVSVDFGVFLNSIYQAQQKAFFVKHIYVFDSKKDHRESTVERYLDSKLNVGVLTFGFWPQQAGMEMMVHNLSSQLTKAGNNVVLFAPKPKIKFKELESNYIIRRFNSHNDMMRIFEDHHSAMPFDVIYVQGAYEPATLALQLKKKFGVPVVLRTHGEDIQVDKESGYGYRLDPSKNKVILNNLKNVDHNVVIGPHILHDVRKLTDVPVSLIYNGVDTEHFTPGKEYEIHDRLKLKRTTKILITVGRNVKKKSLHLAIDALALVKNQYEDVVLVHAGKEGNGLNLLHYAKEKGVSESFYQLGEVSYFDMPKIYRSSDIFLFPAKTETFGNVTVEAMACGLPCVEFDYVVNRDKIVDGVNGFIVNYGDLEGISSKLIHLLSKPSVFKDMKVKSREFSVAKFSWSSIIEKYIYVLTGVNHD